MAAALPVGQGFPAGHWATVFKWFNSADAERKLYFLAIFGRDMFLTHEECQRLASMGVTFPGDLSYSVADREAEVARRLTAPKLSAGDVLLLKRESDRLELSNSVQRKTIQVMFWNIDHTEGQEFKPTEFIDLVRTLQNVNTLELMESEGKDLMAPKDLEHLGNGFPSLSWIEVEKWALHAERDQVLAFLKDFSDSLPHMNGQHLAKLDGKRNSVHNRTFPFHKQMREVGRRVRKPSMQVHTSQMLASQTARLGKQDEFSQFLAEKYEGADENAPVPIPFEKTCFQEEASGLASPFRAEGDLEEKIRRLALAARVGLRVLPQVSESEMAEATGSVADLEEMPRDLRDRRPRLPRINPDLQTAMNYQLDLDRAEKLHPN